MSTTNDQPSSKRRSLGRAVLLFVAWAAFTIAVVGLVGRSMPVANHTVLAAAAFSPYLMVGFSSSALLLLYAGHRWAAAGAAVLLTVAVAAELPMFVGSGPESADGVSIRVLTANLREGTADPEDLAEIARDHDVLVFNELTPELADAFDQTGVGSEFPYTAVDARPAAAGVGIWSRFPVLRSHRFPGYQLGALSASIDVPGSATDTTVVSVHLTGPWPQGIDQWRAELERFPATLRAIAAEGGAGAAIVAGDFNATYDMVPFRALLDNGFRDAAEQSGAGLTPTFPANSSTPPLIGIDHILTFNSSASNAHTVRISGSDHLGVSATVHLPR